MFVTIATVLFGVLAVIWRGEASLNITIKLALTALTLWGVFETAQEWGYILAPAVN